MKTKKPGFTLVELLVVIAIIGILVALLLPAVQAAREAARRMQCSNNLKQLSLAAHNYHDTHKTLPPGWVRSVSDNGAGNNGNAVSFWSWGALILPFVEQEPLYDQLDILHDTIDRAVSDPVKVGLMSETIAAFRCPSDIAPRLNTNGNRDILPGNINTASGNYIGVNSNRWIQRNPAPGRKGIFIETNGRPFRDILDGTSNVAMFGERRWQHKQDPATDAAVGGNNIEQSAAALIFGIERRNNSNHMSCAVGTGIVGINYTGHRNDRERTAFSSEHPGGAMFSLADGSVRFIAETIELEINGAPAGSTNYKTNLNNATNSPYEQILVMDDGEPVQIP